MKSRIALALFCLLLVGCKIQMDECYRAIYEYVGPQKAKSLLMEVTQKGVIKDISTDEGVRFAWVKTEPEMWVEVELQPEEDFREGDRVLVVFLVQFKKEGKLDIEAKWLEAL